MTKRTQEPGKPMTQADDFYVNMMDHHLSKYPGQWAYVHKDSALEEAMLHNEYDEIIGQLPKDQYKAQLIVRKSLEYTPTGDKHDGGVYKLTAIG